MLIHLRSFGFALAALLALTASGSLSASNVQVATGEVDSVQLVDASELGGEIFLIVALKDGRSFQLPDQRQLPAGQGTRVEIRYLAPDEPDLLPEVCSATVLAIPLTIDGEEILREAARPFEVYSNPRSECP